MKQLEPRSDKGPVFTAYYDSDCPRCGGAISEGDQIRYIDDELACEFCVGEEGE